MKDVKAIFQAELSNGKPIRTELDINGLQSAAIIEIILERQRQDEKHGDASHDDGHFDYEWQNFIRERVDRLVHDFRRNDVSVSDTDFRKEMVEIAALAVAAIESYDRKLLRRVYREA